MKTVTCQIDTSEYESLKEFQFKVEEDEWNKLTPKEQQNIALSEAWEEGLIKMTIYKD